MDMIFTLLFIQKLPQWSLDEWPEPASALLTGGVTPEQMDYFVHSTMGSAGNSIVEKGKIFPPGPADFGMFSDVCRLPRQKTPATRRLRGFSSWWRQRGSNPRP
ncbi:MAG: hypothetical protein IJC43_01210, partial [Clostridia bacterium]|nr:hypothetical protein [Clostridia bacterium]